MLKRIDSTLISLVLILGVVHTAFTPVLYKTLSLDAVWFAGTGLALVFLGLLHLARQTSSSSLIVLLSCAASVMATTLSIAIVLKLPKPNAYLCLIANALLVVTSAMA